MLQGVGFVINLPRVDTATYWGTNMQLTFRALQEDTPGAAWKKVFDHGWPGWGSWFLQRIRQTSPDLNRCERALKRYMPEYHPIWEKQLELVGGDVLVAQFLSFWTPPRYLVNCAQAVLREGENGPLLIRNYDLDPRLNEATIYETNWTGNRRVMGMVEGLSGLSDGMNDAGLAISLTFGGRVAAGKGFGVPLIIRYVLEVCRDTQDALEALRNLPSHMSYNLTLVDKYGQLATVFLAPDRPAIVQDTPYTTNHQLGDEWPAHARMSETLKRAYVLEQFLGQPQDEAGLRQRFLSEPLYRRAYDKGFGTVFTALYRPLQGNMALLWPEHPPLEQSFQHFSGTTQLVNYQNKVSEFVPEAQTGHFAAPALPEPDTTHLSAETLWEAEQYISPEMMQLIRKSWRGFATSWHS